MSITDNRHDISASVRGLDRTIVATFVEKLFGFRPADDDPSPIGPWGPVIRASVLPRLGRQLVGPLPDPWILAALNPQLLTPQIDSLSPVALNPQPLPPLPAIMLEALLTRAESIADAARGSGNERAAIEYVRSMVDDLCPPPRIFKIPPKPRGDGEPPPRPEELVFSATDLIVLGAGLREGAAWTAHPELATALKEAGLRGMDVGIEALSQPS